MSVDLPAKIACCKIRVIVYEGSYEPEVATTTSKAILISIMYK